MNFKIYNKKITSIVLASILSISAITFKSLRENNIAMAEEQRKVKNVIFLIPDGMSIATTTLARWYKDAQDGIVGNDKLTLDEIASGYVKTYWANGPITDSAPAATAYALGVKSNNKYVGVDTDKIPKASILEAAKLNGKATGIVATSEIMHATPADFTAHYPDRSNYNALSKQQIYNNADVVLGGGDSFFAKDGAGKRNDNKDLKEEIKKLGYDYVTTKNEMINSKASKIWGVFAPKDLAYDIDRAETRPEEPTLAEMTRKAIEVLSKDKDGFFLMVEGSKIDWAAHANDPVGYETGSTSDSRYKYDNITFADSVFNIKNAKATVQRFNNMIIGKSDSEILSLVSTYYGYNDINSEELAKIKDGKINEVVSNRTKIGFTTGGHTGGDVMLYVYAPYDIERLSGTVDNTEINRYIQRVLGVDLSKATKELFINAKDAFENIGANFTLDLSDSDNPKAIVKKGDITLTAYAYTNKIDINGTEYTLDGVIVYNGDKIFLSQKAVDLFNEKYNEAVNKGSENNINKNNNNENSSSEKQTHNTDKKLPKTGSPFDFTLIVVGAVFVIIIGTSLMIISEKSA
ncbi:MAG: alkaline phosphatase [Caloramator sp.]|uniref:alkaline phosphatase n=1 Tax=Caloramator sp. TaxID=1871330 RepID=UPI001D4A7517|nr:alkaline phosphatase [Caloramator sp.]MBZ4663410.1 alkaline phosphatase [Caloramator sp.]